MVDAEVVAPPPPRVVEGKVIAPPMPAREVVWSPDADAPVPASGNGAPRPSSETSKYEEVDDYEDETIVRKRKKSFLTRSGDLSPKRMPPIIHGKF